MILLRRVPNLGHKSCTASYELRVTTLPYTDKDPNIRVQVFQMKPYFFFF